MSTKKTPEREPQSKEAIRSSRKSHGIEHVDNTDKKQSKGKSNKRQSKEKSISLEVAAESKKDALEATGGVPNAETPLEPNPIRSRIRRKSSKKLGLDVSHEPADVPPKPQMSKPKILHLRSAPKISSSKSSTNHTTVSNDSKELYRLQHALAEKETALVDAENKLARLRTELAEADAAVSEGKRKVSQLTAELQNVAAFDERSKIVDIATKVPKDSVSITDSYESERANLLNQLDERFDEITALVATISEADELVRQLGVGLYQRVNTAIEFITKNSIRFYSTRDGNLKRKASAVVASGLFDPDWYSKQNPDVRKSGMDPSHHFVTYGFREGRAPCLELYMLKNNPRNSSE